MLGGGGLEQLPFCDGCWSIHYCSIIIQLLSMDVIPALTELAKGGATGKKQIDRYTRYLAVVLSFSRHPHWFTVSPHSIKHCW